MCFNKEMSLAFTFASLGISGWILSGKGLWGNIEKWQQWRIAICFWYFAAMELLQFAQYLFIDDCQSVANKILACLGYIHICWQPLFSNLSFSALDHKNWGKKREDGWRIVLLLSAVAGVLMAFRILMPLIASIEDHYIFGPCSKEESICSEKSCVTTGAWHLKWEWKLSQPNYYFANPAVHFLFMFITPFLMGMRIQAIVLFLTGPAIAMCFPGASRGEKAAIWCFFSIGEALITMVTSYYACKSQLKYALKEKQH